MADDFGLSFSPLGNAQQGYGQNAPNQQTNPLQEAIQILSLRRPRVVGATSPIPGPLLNGQGGGMNGMSAIIQNLLSQFGGQSPYQGFFGNEGHTGPSAGPGPVLPTPRITPGQGGAPPAPPAPWSMPPSSPSMPGPVGNPPEQRERGV
jgi:hypothetical protein